MLSYLLAILIVVPMIEIVFLIKIGQYIGAGNTILLVIITGVTGAFLAKYQGLKVLWDIRYLLSQGRMPGYKLLEGLFVLLGGILLLTPGFFTDAIGLLCLLPFTRHFFVNAAIKILANYLRSGRVRIYRF